MTVAELEHFRDLLLAREESLESLKNTAFLNRDQSLKVQALLTEIKEALERVESNTLGICRVCQGEVEKDRLEIQPAAEVCLGCISRKDQALLEEDLHLASKVHRALLPQAVARIDGFEVAVKSLAARIIGGDYYDFLPGRQENSVRIVIADTMGKGLPAGLLMSNVQGALRVLADDIPSPARLIAHLNRWICRNVPVTKFISLFCLNVTTGPGGKFTFVNAGHCPPVMFRSNGDIERFQPTGAVLGVTEKFDYQEGVSIFHPGDLMLLYTDGITDARNARGEMFEELRLLDYVSQHLDESPADIVSGLLDEIRIFSGKSDFDDDLTVVALRRLA
ncbi:MAG: SpoIIE family protein phosphatase [Candidatus Zixiibacteriota bacterium]|nr:MAG: SpoIIE family protein phosphatase [candidate division Zixibacteria bacterium]